CSNRYYSPGSLDLAHAPRRNDKSLRVQLVLFDNFLANRLKSPKTHVQCYTRQLGTRSLRLLQNFRSEMQTGGRWRNRSALSREHRLVSLAIGCGIITPDIRWKRNMADAFNGRVHIAIHRESNRALAVLSSRNNLKRDTFVEFNPLADRSLASRPNQ